MTSYHHGDLRRAVIERALEVVADQGASGLSLRAIASDLGVSHTAPRHHFGSNAGLLTAIAAEGFSLLCDRLVELRISGAPFLELGVAYVQFAMEHPAHFSVMFQPHLLEPGDPSYTEASGAAFAELLMGADAMASGDATDAAVAVTAAWSLMHGLAELELTGNLARSQLRAQIDGGDIAAIARRAGTMLVGAASGEDR